MMRLSHAATISSRIVLGTVQLGLEYGMRTGAGRMTEAEADAILDAAWELGIRAYDTAEAYGLSSPRLARWVGSRTHTDEVQIVTKVSRTDPVARAVANAVDVFTGGCQLAVLTHGWMGSNSWPDFREACVRSGGLPGASVYTADEAGLASRLPGLMRLQIPGNVFDRRCLNAIPEEGPPVDVRSVFLQGILTADADAAERRVKGAGELNRIVHEAADMVGHDAPALLLAVMIADLRPCDRVVLGVDLPDQLRVVGDAFRLPAADVTSFRDTLLDNAAASGIAERILDPRHWS